MLLIFIATCFLILLDQLSKNFIIKHFTLGESKEIITNFFSISSHLFKQKETLNGFDKLTFALIYGGSIGNFIDRLTRHEVVDFLDFRIFGYDFPIFNLADCFICVGVVFLLFKIYREED